LSVKGFSYARKGYYALSLQPLNGGPQALCPIIRVRRHGLKRRHGSLSGPAECCGPIGIAKADTSGLRSGQGGFGPVRNKLALLLCHKGHDAHRKVISVWHIRSDEPDTAILEGQEKGSITRQAI